MDRQRIEKLIPVRRREVRKERDPLAREGLVAEMLRHPDPPIGLMRLRDLLTALYDGEPETRRQLLAATDIYGENRMVGRLTPEERQRLADAIHIPIPEPPIGSREQRREFLYRLIGPGWVGRHEAHRRTSIGVDECSVHLRKLYDLGRLEMRGVRKPGKGNAIHKEYRKIG